MKLKLIAAVASLTVLLGSIRWANAQWQTQSFLVKPGWTAIYLHVDPSYTNLDYMIGNDRNNPISEVWLWEPAASTLQFVTSPQAPITASRASMLRDPSMPTRAGNPSGRTQVGLHLSASANCAPRIAASRYVTRPYSDSIATRSGAIRLCR